MTITPSSDPIVSISIELLPEFGFTVQDEPVYGPGSVFQGKIMDIMQRRNKHGTDRLS